MAGSQINSQKSFCNPEYTAPSWGDIFRILAHLIVWKGTCYPPQYSAEILNFGWRDDYVMWFNNPNEAGDDGTHFGRLRQGGNIGKAKANVRKKRN